MRLIDADKPKTVLLQVIAEDEQQHHDTHGLKLVLHLLDVCPTVDAVPVVRCKDCEHRSYCGIKKDLGTTDTFGYCPRGKKRKVGKENA